MRKLIGFVLGVLAAVVMYMLMYPDMTDADVAIYMAIWGIVGILLVGQKEG